LTASLSVIPFELLIVLVSVAAKDDLVVTVDRPFGAGAVCCQATPQLVRPTSGASSVARPKSRDVRHQVVVCDPMQPTDVHAAKALLVDEYSHLARRHLEPCRGLGERVEHPHARIGRCFSFEGDCHAVDSKNIPAR
jgi:hypothetical protein